ncbi:hypothetical protein V7x_47500 [Crateriforma conspicua]|uniref:Uncharacterized protein n=1 Tax=Crateriforma conspicua TaxID=2527996 RepID=A0A5C6FRA2_9PLAN|nr:hypothetical protein [Crateriforma conspicua]TWU63013.1 hypothetical protein V7x_47500 [Crateriforma conspicua]
MEVAKLKSIPESQASTAVHWDANVLHACRVHRTWWGGFSFRHASQDFTRSAEDVALSDLLNSLGHDLSADRLVVGCPLSLCQVRVSADSPVPIESSNGVAGRQLRFNDVSREMNGGTVLQSFRLSDHFGGHRVDVTTPGGQLRSIVSALHGGPAAQEVNVVNDRSQVVAITPDLIVPSAGWNRPFRSSSMVAVHVFLGLRDQWVCVCCGGVPVLVRRCPLPGGDEASGVLDVVEGLVDEASGRLFRHRPASRFAADLVVVYGRDELKSLISTTAWGRRWGQRWTWLPAQTLDRESIAMNLALRGQVSDSNGTSSTPPSSPHSNPANPNSPHRRASSEKDRSMSSGGSSALPRTVFVRRQRPPKPSAKSTIRSWSVRLVALGRWSQACFEKIVRPAPLGSRTH